MRYNQASDLDYINHFDDFQHGINIELTSPAGVATALLKKTVTEAGAGSAAMTIDDLHGGWLKIINDDASGDCVTFQTTSAFVKLASGKDGKFLFNLTLADTTSGSFAFGCATKAGGDIIGTPVANGIYIIKPAAATTLYVYVYSSSVAVKQLAIDVGTTTNTSYELSYKTNADGTLTISVRKATADANGNLSWQTVLADYSIASYPSAAMAPFFEVRNGAGSMSAANRTYLSDYFGWSVKR